MQMGKKKAIGSLKLLYSLVDTGDGQGDEFPGAEVHCEREQAAEKRLVALLFPGDPVSVHWAPQRDFLQCLLQAEDH